MKNYINKIKIIIIIILGLFIQYKYINFITSISDDKADASFGIKMNLGIYLDKADVYNTIYDYDQYIGFKEFYYSDKKMKKIIKYKYWKKNDKNTCQNLYNNMYHNIDDNTKEIYDNYIHDIPSLFSLDNYYFYIEKSKGKYQYLLIADVHNNTVYFFY